MTEILTNPLLWGALVVVFALIELGTAGFVAGFLAAGSFITMFLVHYGLTTTFPGIALGFTLGTLASAALLWFPLKKFYIGRKTTDEEEGLVGFIGDTGTVVSESLTVQGGTIRIHDVRMSAVLAKDLSVTTVPSGTRVKVTGRDHEQRLVVVLAD
ncbi:MAG: hypothetical protein GC134_00925 [Proteobacteria bacterium]|nr:hypothetical protein [Pseudomonadota bacterium]